MHIRPVRSGCHEHDRWRQKSNVPTSVFTFLMFHDDALQISTFSKTLCPEKKCSFSIHIRSSPGKWSIESLLSTFLTLFLSRYPLKGCSYLIRKLGCACAVPRLGVCVDCIKVSQLTNDHNDDDGPPPPPPSASILTGSDRFSPRVKCPLPATSHSAINSVVSKMIVLTVIIPHMIPSHAGMPLTEQNLDNCSPLR